MDCYRKLAEIIMGLQIKTGSKVEDFVLTNDKITTYLDTAIKGAKITDSRYFDDGSCEVDMEVTIEQIVDSLKHSFDEVYKGGEWKREEFNEITKHPEYKIIKATGSGRSGPTAGFPTRPSEPIVQAPHAHYVHIVLPEIYKKYPAAERLKARRVAELDAYRLLTERISGLQVAAGTRVGGFLIESDKIKSYAEMSLRGARTINIRYNPDGIVEVEMQVTIEQVIATLKQSYDEVYKGGQWKKEQFDDITKYTKQKVLTVVGAGPMDTEAHKLPPGVVEKETIITN